MKGRVTNPNYGNSSFMVPLWPPFPGSSCLQRALSYRQASFTFLSFCLSEKSSFPPPFFGLFVFSRAAPVAYGGSRARGLIRSCSLRPTPGPQQHGIQAVTASYTTDHGNVGSLTPLSKARDQTCNHMVSSRIR